jgi:hypothetical protein
MTLVKLVRSNRGRPQKFGRRARAVTLTLPEDVIAALRSVDPDISRAVVSLAHPGTPSMATHPAAEISRHSGGALIVVRPCAPLRRIKGVRLVPLADGRALISLDDGLSIQAFELKMRDALEEEPATTEDCETLASVIRILKEARLRPGVTVHQRSIIILQSARRRKVKAAPKAQ